MQDLNVTTKFEILEITEDPETRSQFGRFSIEPLESGWGITIGNSLRRVLLSSIEGAAVTAVQIEGVIHEFSSLPNVQEDIADIMLNIKGIILRSHSEVEETLTLNFSGSTQGTRVTAGDIEKNSAVDIINPAHYLATLYEGGALLVRLFVNRGKGYRETQEKIHPEHNIIPIDSIFTPVKKVNYHVLDTRVGQFTNYDKLVLEIWTSGAISPQEALNSALAHIVTQFSHLRELLKERSGELAIGELIPEVESSGEDRDIPIKELELSVRAFNCLKRAKINTLRELLEIINGRSEDLKKIKNLGQKTYEEIVEKVSRLGYDLHEPTENEVNQE
ncbi:MAG TPA: DNA-directed RNA polymerase subunit alpha [Atribacteraceae bacterium]|nr:DNA-directed RNA polymerase subunit alpha [Atribacteraceae bacterium]